MTDDHHLLARYRRDQQHATILAHAAQTAPAGTPMRHTKLPPGGDPWALRGIPAIGYGIPGGAIPGTRPDQLP